MAVPMSNDTLHNWDLFYEDLPSAPREKRHKNSSLASNSSRKHSNTNKQPVLGREYVLRSRRVVEQE